MLRFVRCHAWLWLAIQLLRNSRMRSNCLGHIQGLPLSCMWHKVFFPNVFFFKSPSRKAITMAGWLFPCWIGTEPEPWYCFLGGCLSAWFCSICAVIQPNCTFNLLSGLALHHQWRAWSLFGFARAGRDITQSHEPWRATSCCLSPMCLRLAVIKVIQGVWTRL